MRFHLSVFIVTLLIGVSVGGCQHNREARVPARYGAAETVLSQPIAEQAILLANLALPPEQRLRLQPTWRAVGFFPKETFTADAGRPGFQIGLDTSSFYDQAIIFVNADTVPVFLIDQQSLGTVELAFVPDGCRCVFINQHSLDDLFHRLYLTGPDAVEEHGGFDKAVALSLVLLHELGHIHYGDRDSYASNASLDISELNRPSQTISNPEVRADAFASEVVRMAWSSGEMQSPLYGPYGRAEIASNIFRVMETGFNSYDLRYDPQGVLDQKQKYDLFGSNGYSHLNLYLRLLIFLEQSEPTQQRARYLELIGQARNRVAMAK